ncbi:pirin family protein [Pedobacter panaciterrae]|uniref:pirin family protein n=1 Tax=Pedobacter panaciterrae TaxID=363849 RepID=UPI00155DBB4C|nr:pirin family protein [Pedobacter panaciterrae]NQX56839.1 pirin family protein [Pedobacter panaciterrae]
MIQQFKSSDFRGNGPIQALYPGLVVGTADTGIGSIGRIDHATFKGKHHIAMHPHVNDEILSYFRSGKVVHRDSEGFHESIGANRLMLMKAGRMFQHEEDIDGQTEPHEGLQIFIRPGVKDLKPEVVFQDLDKIYSDDQWRLLASTAKNTVFQFSSQTWIYDVRLSAGNSIGLPVLPVEGLTQLLYVFKGDVTVNKTFQLKHKEGLIIRDEEIAIQTLQGAELVLFVTDENTTIFKEGMYSGNQLR